MLTITINYTRIIKVAPRFELSIQFLFWVTQKVIALSNFDILLT